MVLVQWEMLCLKSKIVIQIVFVPAVYNIFSISQIRSYLLDKT